MLFLAGGAVAGTHHAALGLQAGAHAHAARRGAFQGSLIGRKDEVCFQFGLRLNLFPAWRGRPVAQVLHRIVDADGIHQLAGIHAVVRVPQDLELAESLDQCGPKHLGQQRRAGLPVAMFTRKRPAQRQNQVGGAIDELPEAPQTLDGAEVEVDAQVNATLSVMAVKRAAVAVLGHQRRELAQVGAQVNGGNAGVVPALPTFRLAGNKDRGAERRLADLPHAFRVFGVVNARPGSLGPALRGMDQRFSLGLCFCGGPRAHLHQQKAAARRQQLHIVDGQMLAQHEVHQQPVKALQTDRPELQNQRHNIGSQEWIVKGERRQHAVGRARGQVQRGGNHRRARPLRAHQGAGQVEAVLVQQFV